MVLLEKFFKIFHPHPPLKSQMVQGKVTSNLPNYYLCYTNAFTNHYEVVLWTKTSNKLFSHLIIIPRTRVGYELLSHALKNTANQRPGLPLHILRYATGNIQRVVFYSTFPSLLARNSLLGVHLRTWKPTPKLFNSCEPIQTFPITSGNFPKISEHFPIF